MSVSFIILKKVLHSIEGQMRGIGQTRFRPAVRELHDEGGTLEATWLNI